MQGKCAPTNTTVLKDASKGLATGTIANITR